jgi:hypothetical protein
MSKWIALSEALSLVGIDKKEQLFGALLTGDVKMRADDGDGTVTAVDPKWLPRSRIDWACSRFETTMPPWRRGRVEVNRQDLLDYFGGTGKAEPKNAVGRPPEWEWEEAIIGVFGQIYRGDVPEPKKKRGGQADIQRLLADWFSAHREDGDHPNVDSGDMKKRARLIWQEIHRP